MPRVRKNTSRTISAHRVMKKVFQSLQKPRCDDLKLLKSEINVVALSVSHYSHEELNIGIEYAYIVGENMAQAMMKTTTYSYTYPYIIVCGISKNRRQICNQRFPKPPNTKVGISLLIFQKVCPPSQICHLGFAIFYPPFFILKN